MSATASSRGAAQSLRRAWSDVALIVEAREFDVAAYRLARGLAETDETAVVFDFVVHGGPAGITPRRGFDADFVRVYYERLAVGHTAPYQFFLAYRHLPWCFAARDDAEPTAGKVRAAPTSMPTSTGARCSPGATTSTRRCTIAPRATRWGCRRWPASTATAISPSTATSGPSTSTPSSISRTMAAARVAAAAGRRPAGRSPTADAASIRSCRRCCSSPTKPAARARPLVAAHLAAEWSNRANVVVWLGRDGPLRPAFQRVAVAWLVAEIEPGTGPALVSMLAGQHVFAFAAVNSIVGWPALSALFARSIPSLLLLHEYADYVAPAGTVAAAVLRASTTVVPARAIAASISGEFERLGAPACAPAVHVRHQGRCDTGIAGAADQGLGPDEILARLGLAETPGGQRPFIVLGAGWVQPRKGVELFVEVARRFVTDCGRPCRFVWVGGNFDPETDMGQSLMIADQVAKSGLGGTVCFFPEQPSLDGFWAVADAFLLSSRFDPFPNVVLDALWATVPVVCFEGTTGASELCGRDGRHPQRRLYHDAGAAAAALADIADRRPQLATRLAAERETWRRRLDFAAYADEIFDLGLRRQAPPPIDAAGADPDFDPAWFALGTPAWALAGERGRFRAAADLRLDRTVAARAGARFARRHPAVHAGRPDAPAWIGIEIEPGPPQATLTPPAGARIGLHLHLAEDADPGEVAALVAGYRPAATVVTTGSRHAARRFAARIEAETGLVPEGGPAHADRASAFLAAVRDRLSDCDAVCSLGLEARRPQDDPVAAFQRGFSRDMAAASRAAALVAAADGPALVFADLPARFEESASLRVAAALARACGRDLPADLAERPRPVGWHVWIAPARLPELLSADLAAAVAGEAALHRESDRRAGFALFLASLAEARRPLAALYAEALIRRLAPRYPRPSLTTASRAAPGRFVRLPTDRRR